MKLKGTCAFLLYLINFISISALSLADEPLRVAFGNALPPWVIPERNEGILLDMVRQTLEPAGYDVDPVYFPYARRLSSYRSGKVDVVSDINPKIIKEEKLEGYFSVIAYAYENHAVSLKQNNFKFRSIADLNGHSILAWQGAKEVLGKEYANLAQGNLLYDEHPNQELQIRMLFYHRIDVIQLDKEIFRYFRRKVASEGKIDTSPEVDSVPLFGENRCGFLFRTRKARDDFNMAFKALNENGKITDIYNYYLSSSLQ